MKKILWLITFLFICPASIKAFQCTQSTYDALQQFANNITVSLEEYDSNNGVRFRATFTGVYSKLRFEVKNMSGVFFGGDGENLGEFTVNDLRPGRNYVFDVYGADSCFTHKFRTFTLNLPDYNKYYNEGVCRDAREYSLCQKWVKVDLTYEEFLKKVDEYVKNRENANQKSPIGESGESLFWYLYEKYYWLALSSLVIFLGILIWLWIKENNKNKL